MSEFHFLGSAQIPKGWELRRLKHVGTVLSGTGFPHDYQGNEDGEFPFLKVSDLSAPGSEKWVSYAANTVDREMAKELGASIVPENSIIYAKIGAALLLNKRRLLSRPSCIDNNMSAFVPKIVLPEWALWWMTILDFSEYVNPGAIPSFTEGQQKELPFLVPPLKTQRRIADYLDRETARIDALIAEKEKMLALLEEKRTALISSKVTRGLNPDAPMKPSGLDWLGDIPAHWGILPIKYVAQVGNGSTPAVDNPEYWGGGGLPWLNSSVVNDRYVAGAVRRVTPLALKECHLPIIEPPVVLMGITGQGKTRGKVTVLTFKATLNQHLAFIKPMKRILSAEYLRYVLVMAYPFLRSESESGGSTKGAITCDQIAGFRIPCPSIEEQYEIVGSIKEDEEKFTGLYKEVSSSLMLLKERRAALITAAVTGQLDPEEMAA
ncbi:MAG TPA: restriction endonuclease subunit S [Devosia sp.]|nr:restriction endonuclease subunit S [Devosia sp.]